MNFSMKSFLGPEEVVGTGGGDRCWVPVEVVTGHARARGFDQHSGPGRRLCTIYTLPVCGARNLGSFGVGQGREWVINKQHLSHCARTQSPHHRSHGS